MLRQWKDWLWTILTSDLLIIIQVRMGSSRLMGKSMLQLGKYKLIEWVLIRLLDFYHRDNIYIATTDSAQDDILIELVSAFGVNIFRGSENNVFSRFKKIAESNNACQNIVRVCADNPFISANLIAEKLKYKQVSKLEYCHSLRLLPNYPFIDGLGSEVFSSHLFKQIDERKLENFHLEHVTSSFSLIGVDFNTSGLPTPPEYCFPEISLDIDTRQDYISITRLISAFDLNPGSSDSEIISAANTYFKSETTTKKFIF